MNRKSTLIIVAAALSAATLLTTVLLAKNQRNDSPPDAQLGPTPHPVPLLSPEDEAKTLNLPPGLHAEVVASEPMIEHPVQIQFDPDGRLWVVEMRGYMPNVDGKGEDKPVGQISILEDTDGDGRMDKKTVFMDHLVMPRALGLCRDGALVGIPPKVLFAQDTNHDGVADKFEEVAADYGITGNPEHQPNGLLYALDNWYWNADYSKRFRYTGDKWLADIIPDMGQWGISQDDYGRLFHDTNSDQIRAALIPPSYANRNPYYRSTGANVQLQKDQTVWPSHDTAENRGYSKNFLRPDGTLREFTAACDPFVYRGDLLPHDFQGNVFVCEVSANVIRRNLLLDQKDGILVAKNAYDKKEFIASTYERFRPVHLADGPDGALYVCDMHHGLIQHTEFVTTYAIKQYLGRQLDKHLATGRIFRIVPDQPAPRRSEAAGSDSPNPQSAIRNPKSPHLSTATTPELISLLSHPNGWYRTTAQRLLVEQNKKAAVSPLRKLVTTSDNPLARLHALWTLDGTGWLDLPTLLAALDDKDPHVRSAAIRLSEPFLYSQRRDKVLPKILSLSTDPDPNVRLQFTLSAAELGTPETDRALASILSTDPANPLLRDAALTGLHGRELDFLTLLTQEHSSSAPQLSPLLTSLAQCLVTQGDPKRVSSLLDLSASLSDWKQQALLAAFPEPETRKGAVRHRPIAVPAEPASLTRLRSSPDPKVQAAVPRIEAIVHWPGQAGYVPPPPVKPLTPEEQERFALGQQVYTALCGQCHKPDGMGKENFAPPLVDSEWVLGPESRLARIALNGVHGPINVNGKTWNLEMPAWKMLPDDKIAAALTYVRRAWGHTAPPISPDTVHQVREQTSSRPEPWTERDLLNIK